VGPISAMNNKKHVDRRYLDDPTQCKCALLGAMRSQGPGAVR
jgi:hypothetical protein